MGTDLVQFNPDQLDLIKRTIAKDATNDELALFIHQCERTGLDPINKQIYFQKRQGKVVIITAIDGLRLIAQRTGQYAGGGKASYCGKDGVWKDIWVDAEPPVAAKVIVQKVVQGLIIETEAVAHYSEYVVKYNGKPGDMWAKMPRNQLAKCAEALALRKAFPAEMSGIYTEDEMGQADNDRGAGASTRKDEGAALTPGEPRPAERGATNPAPRLPPANVNPETGEIIVVQSKPEHEQRGILQAGLDATEQRRQKYAAPPSRTATSAQNTARIMADLGETPREIALVDRTDAKELMRRIGALQGDMLAAFNAEMNKAGLVVPTQPTKVTRADYEAIWNLLPDTTPAEAS